MIKKVVSVVKNTTNQTTISQFPNDYPFGHYKTLYLECTTGSCYKFYEMMVIGAEWIARYGAIGNRGQTKSYNNSEWSKKLREKLVKGYIIKEVTDLKNINKIIVPKRGPKHFNVNDDYLNRIKLVVDAVGNTNQIGIKLEVEQLYERYFDTGVLTKDNMIRLNELYNKFIVDNVNINSKPAPF